METITAKVFKAGNSQAVRLPKGYRFKSKTVQIVKTPSGVSLLDPAAVARRLRALEKLYAEPLSTADLERP